MRKNEVERGRKVTGTTEETTAVSVRIRRGLITQGIAAVFALSVPIVLVLYWLTLPSGGWIWVLVAQGIILVGLGVAVYRGLRVQVSVSATHLIERRFFGPMLRIPLDEIDRVIMLEMHRTMASQPRLQMFVLSSRGTPLLRMRGEYWSRSSINRIASQLTTAPIEHVDHPITLDELQTTRPEMLYWFERRPSRMP